MDFHVYFHNVPDPATTATLARLEKQIAELGEKIMADLVSITAAVAAETSVVESAVTLLNSLNARLIAAGTDPVALQALSDQITANTNSLAAAVVANTPAA